MGKTNILVLAIFIALFCPEVSAATGDWSELIAKAHYASAQGKFGTAEDILGQAMTIAVEPYARYSTAFALGCLQKQAGEYDRARTNFALCQSLASSNAYLQNSTTQKELIALDQRLGREDDLQSDRELGTKYAEYQQRVHKLMAPYMNELEVVIHRNWHPPAIKSRQELQLSTTCNWLVDRGGNFSVVHISQSSSNELADKAALDCVHNLGNFSRLPPGMPPFVVVNFSFDYNIHSTKGFSIGNEKNMKELIFTH